MRSAHPSPRIVHTRSGTRTALFSDSGFKLCGLCVQPVSQGFGSVFLAEHQSFEVPDRTRGVEVLERKHGAVLVGWACGFVSCAACGISLSELEDVMSMVDEVLRDCFQWWTPPHPRIPPLLLTRLVADLREAGALAPHAAPGSLMRWQHRVFAEAAKQRYGSEAQVQRMHQVLAYYFLGRYHHASPPFEHSWVKPNWEHAHPSTMRPSTALPRSKHDCMGQFPVIVPAFPVHDQHPGFRARISRCVRARLTQVHTDRSGSSAQLPADRLLAAQPL